MRTILLLIEYDGTAYAGWQVQPNGLAVQAVVEEALQKVIGEPARLHSAGRTDAGVHARAMPVHFKTDKDLPLSAFREGVNRFLPEDIAVREARNMPDGFHARFSAQNKLYRYTLFLGDVRSPLAARTSWQLRGSLDLTLLRRTAADLVGQHDFKAFQSASCAAKTSVREILDITVQQADPFVTIDVRGSGFLKNMVRMLVGTLVEIGQGRRPPEDIRRLLAGDESLRSSATAPPQGLCLIEVTY
jgi:tRNA pseudouridine38-40 synthase